MEHNNEFHNLVNYITSHQTTSKSARYNQTVKKRSSKLIWDKVFKKGPSKICGRQPLKNFKNLVCLRLSSTNLTWSILEYFAPYNPQFLMNTKAFCMSL